MTSSRGRFVGAWWRARWIGALGAACVFAACAAEDGTTASDASEINAVDRRLVGQGEPYVPDRSLWDQSSKLAASAKERRRAAWEIAARVLAPIARQLPDSPSPEAAPGAAAITLPRFQTWYSASDFESLTAHVVGGISKDARARGDAIPDGALDAAFPWLAGEGALADAEWSDQRFFARRNELQTPEGAASIAGAETRTLMSPALVRQLLAGYALADRCWKAADPSMPPDDPSSKVHAPCVKDGGFARDAAVVKMSWIDAQAPFRVYDTSAGGLAARLDAGQWGDGQTVDPPAADRIYTMRRLSDPTRADSPPQTMRLTALHVATKELEHWFWITLWWSPDPDTDFGADRPDSIRALGGPWRNYKMCTTVDYDELDPDPEGGFHDSAPTLAAALRASREHGAPPGTSPPTPRSWCSNPYLEDGARNAPTNCIGCHQHGGIRRPGPTTIRNDETHFPDNTRRKVRTDFPFDYLWSASSTAELAKMLSDAARAP